MVTLATAACAGDAGLSDLPGSRDCRSAVGPAAVPPTMDLERIRPYEANPCYWQYRGEPILLLGASDEEDLFNHPDIWPFGLESHLDLMVRHGGNYVRNTMTGRHPDPVWPFARDDDGLYDLDRWNEEYWTRFRRFLELTHERDVIVQLEIWNRVSYAREEWDRNPFNPRNTRSYDAETSGLPEPRPR